MGKIANGINWLKDISSPNEVFSVVCYDFQFHCRYGCVDQDLVNNEQYFFNNEVSSSCSYVRVL